jgi:hypothetical protein
MSGHENASRVDAGNERRSVVADRASAEAKRKTVAPPAPSAS